MSLVTQDGMSTSAHLYSLIHIITCAVILDTPSLYIGYTSPIRSIIKFGNKDVTIHVNFQIGFLSKIIVEISMEAH